MSQEIKKEDGEGSAQGQSGAERSSATRETGLKQPPPFDPSVYGRAATGNGHAVHDESQMDHPRGPLNEKFKFFLANLPPSVTALEMRRHFEAYGNVNFVKLIYNKATGVSMGYGFLYVMDDETDRRVEEYSVRNNYRIRFANFSRIYLQRNDKTRTRPMRGDGKPMGVYGGYPRDQQRMGPGRPHDWPPFIPPPAGGRKPQMVKEELTPLRQLGANESRLRYGIPGPPPPLPRAERPELWNRYPADRVQPEHPAPYPLDARAYENGYYEQHPASEEHYEDQQYYAAAHDPTGGYDDHKQSSNRDAGYQQYYNEDNYYDQSYKGDAEHHQQTYHGDGQRVHQGYGDQEQGYWRDDGHTGDNDGGQYNAAGVYQQGEYYEGNVSSEAYAYPQQRGEARQAGNHGYSQNRPHSAESSYPRESAGHSGASYSHPQEGNYFQNNHADFSIAGHRSHLQSSDNFRGGARGGYSRGGRGRGGGGVNSQRFQRRDRPY